MAGAVDAAPSGAGADPGAATQRTSLSWSRTLLTFSAVTVLLIYRGWTATQSWVVLGAVLVPLAALGVALVRQRDLLQQRQSRVRVGVMRSTAALVVVLAVVGMVAIVR